MRNLIVDIHDMKVTIEGDNEIEMLADAASAYYFASKYSFDPKEMSDHWLTFKMADATVKEINKIIPTHITLPGSKESVSFLVEVTPKIHNLFKEEAT